VIVAVIVILAARLVDVVIAALAANDLLPLTAAKRASMTAERVLDMNGAHDDVGPGRGGGSVEADGQNRGANIGVKVSHVNSPWLCWI
jgi:hypothetical protein